MRENLGRKGRVSNKFKAMLFAIAAVFAVSAVAATSANAADGNVKMSFDSGKIAVLPALLGPIDADPPAGSPVVVEGTLAENGAFSAPKEGFNFPTQRIDLPEDPFINGILGTHVNIILAPTGAFTGNFDRATGAFTSSIPLALTLEFSPPDKVLACRLPFNLAVNTTGTLTFPEAGEGGADLSFNAAPFASPSGNGSIYGSWPAVKFADIEDREDMDDWREDPLQEKGYCATLLELVPMLVPGWPPGLDGLEGEIWLSGNAVVTDPPVQCPDGQVGTPPDCKPKPVETCPAGTIGTPPDCKKVVTPEPPKKPNFSRLVVTPKKANVKRGKRATLTVRVTNSGNAAGSVRVTFRSSNKQVKVAKSINVRVGAKKTVTRKIRVTTTKRAKGKANITVKMAKRTAKTALTIRR